MTQSEYIARQTSIEGKRVNNVIALFNEGATTPFIARYRKDRTGNLDEEKIDAIQVLMQRYDELLKRKEFIKSAISEKGQLTTQLEEKIEDCFDPNKLEDIYHPFKTKRQSKAEKALKAGLGALAGMIMKQQEGDPEYWAERFLKQDYPEPDEALEGACYIVAEWVSENEIVRDKLRQSFFEHGVITTKLVKGKESEGEKYKDYFSLTQRLSNVPSYRMLAILRAADEGIIKYKIEPNTDYVLNWLNRFFVKKNNEAADLLQKCLKDAYKRLLQPTLQTETKNHFKELADDKSIQNFAKNLKNLLMAAPIGSKRVLALDPGFKSGCKLVCLNEEGDLKHNENIYPHSPQKKMSEAKSKIYQLVESYNIDVIAIGDGTASRETENMIKHMRFSRDVEVFVVREDGASIYSASKIAREEFGQYDVTVRGAVSIGRRLMDPMAELVKIDPKSLGVGQYQHDVNQNKLQDALDRVVVNSVNKVGVNLNTASKYLLNYVAGLGPKLAENIVDYRQKNGAFSSRAELKKVDRLGASAFEQSAGFLRVRESENPLDNTAVHPEHYSYVEGLAKKLGHKVVDVIKNDELIDQLEKLAGKEDSVGEFTREDIFKELRKPGLDPRKKAKILEFAAGLKTIEDLKTGMKVTGIVTNVTDFGAFVNIGIKENGLIHKTKLSKEYVQNPADFISIDEHVECKVVSVEVDRKRIGLSLID
ncbi:MAG: RNA-binding transcriptional accessory protein [Crocinitomicaceae bacterium]|nr:RNA-binding transcriptional accessory protein [Crocinitomicaceae bacterium]